MVYFKLQQKQFISKSYLNSEAFNQKIQFKLIYKASGARSKYT